MNDRKAKVSWKKWGSLFFIGICIGLADIVPGVSGGTIAFILGIYDELIASIKSVFNDVRTILLKGSIRTLFRLSSVKFLVSISLGIAFAFILFAKSFYFILNHEIYRSYLYSLFIGLVIGSSVYCFRYVETIQKRDWIALVIAAIFALYLTSSTPGQSKDFYSIPYSIDQIPVEYKMKAAQNSIHNYNNQKEMITGLSKSDLEILIAKGFVSSKTMVLSNRTNTFITVADVLQNQMGMIEPYFIFSGVVAVCAMLLPGISGSYMLQVLGVYGTILSLVVETIDSIIHGTLDVTSICLLSQVGIGLIIGALLFSRVVSYLLKNHHASTFSALVGFMLGSLGSIWPFCTYDYILDITKTTPVLTLIPKEWILPSSITIESLINYICIVIGFSLVYAVEHLSNKRKAISKDLDMSHVKV